MVLNSGKQMSRDCVLIALLSARQRAARSSAGTADQWTWELNNNEIIKLSVVE